MSAQKWQRVTCAIAVLLQSLYGFGLFPGDHLMTHDVPWTAGGDANAEARPVANTGAGMSGDQRAAHAHKPKSFWNDSGVGSHLDLF